MLYKKNKKSQAWEIDLVIAVSIFLIGVLVFFIYSINQSVESLEKLDIIFYKGKNVMDNILSEGYPKDWNKDNVIRIGILDNGKINETKLERFYNLTQENYFRTKIIFNTEYDYYFFFKNLTIGSSAVEGIGKPNTNLSNINAENLVKISRVTIYKNEPKQVYLYVWEE